MSTEVSSPYVFVDDITNGLENFKISFFNDINFQKIPNHVKYIPNNILSSDALTEDFESIPFPCKCKELCDNFCSCGLGSNIAYKNGLLLEDFMKCTSKPLIECFDLCSCQSNCSNKVVQKGITKQLQVFMTELKGLGVQTLEFIPKFTFVCEYAGELIDKLEAEIRIKNRPSLEPNYVFILKEHVLNQSNISTIIDPTNFGNVGRYLNHSCSSNLIPVPVRVDCMLPRICFFAKRDIMPYEELTYNYGIDISLKEKENTVSQVDCSVFTFKKCCCQSFQCSGVLPFDANSLS